MKKVFLFGGLAILVFILAFATYSFIWGGKPQTENFDDKSYDYETIANLSLEYYNAQSHDEDYIVLSTYDDYIEDRTSGSKIELSDEHKKAIKTVNETFGGGSLRVSKNSVTFWQDETKYYGLVYSKNPLFAVWDMKTDWYENVEYHRINGNWYEVGAFGI